MVVATGKDEGVTFDDPAWREGEATRFCQFDPDDDRLQEECGVFGVYGLPDAAALTALGLHALQHRGQEACGIATYCEGQFHSERRMGLVGDAFNRQAVIDRLLGDMAVGHVRYSTAGGTLLRNVQPLFAELDKRGFALAHNGNLTNAQTLRRELVRSGAIFQSTSDTEVILHLVARSKGSRIVERVIDGIRQIEGAYALVCLTNDMLIAARDPVGIRPLVIGRLNNGYILASETCALDIVGATYLRDVENGEVIVIDENGLHSHRPFPKRPARPCIFEYIYFARPDSVVGGKSVHHVRKKMGMQLAEESPVQADLIVPIPDSGIPAALGFSEHSGIPFDFGIIRNRYVGRTFIEPEQQIRALGVKLKHSANAELIRGKRIVLIDDSIVRGTTSKKLVQLMRDAGAREVHMRIACPEIKHGDYYGIDTPKKTELLAANMTREEMRAFVGADSLAFLSVDGLYHAMGFERRDPAMPQFTDHCFTGEYPTSLTDQQDSTIEQLSLLAEAQ
jgi:amidophosphoribosyltransferase